MKRRGFFRSLIGAAVTPKVVSSLPKPVETIKVAETIFKVPKIPQIYSGIPYSYAVFPSNIKLGTALNSAKTGQILHMKLD